MGSKTFINMSRADCLNYYNDVLRNSESNWRSSRILADEKQFGNAMSMAIISSEELVKAIVILLDGKGFRFRRVPGMGSLFANHQIRYVILYAMLVMNIFSDEIRRFLEQWKVDPTKGMKLIYALQNNDINFTKQFERYGLQILARLVSEFEWFSKIDVYRQDGFYSDYEDQLKTPIDIDAETYNQAMLRLEKVRSVGLEVVRALVSTEQVYINHLNVMQQQLIEKKTYEQIGKALAVLRRTRENPFTVIRGYFGDGEQGGRKRVEL